MHNTPATTEPPVRNNLTAGPQRPGCRLASFDVLLAVSFGYYEKICPRARMRIKIGDGIRSVF